MGEYGGVGTGEDICLLYMIVFVDDIDRQRVEEFEVIQKKLNLVASQSPEDRDLGAYCALEVADGGGRR